MMNNVIRIVVETTSGSPLFIGNKNYHTLPARGDLIFYDGENYKVVYRKFIFLVGNQDISQIIFKVEKVEKKF